MQYDIVIPSCKPEPACKSLLKEIADTSSPERLIFTGFNVSAATNRNYGLNLCGSPVVIMVDDDMTGFTPGWAERLIAPIIQSDSNPCPAIMTSPRLYAPDGTPGTMLDIKLPPFGEGPWIPSDVCALPTACVAFPNEGTRFDEHYIGSGFEDTDFCHQLNNRYPNNAFVIVNDLKLIHINEMKNQKGKFWNANKAYYLQKWTTRKAVA